MHSGYVWNWDRVRHALDFIERNDMTSLVLHRNDLVDLVVYPGALFGASPEASNIFERYREIFTRLYKYTPTRRSGPYQRRGYLCRILELAGRRGISVYIENKELYFPEVFTELFPELTEGGTLCASHPFWHEFLAVKYRELFEDLPGIAGVITSPGTGESRLSYNSNRCTCDRCRAMTAREWYSGLLMSMHAPIRAAGAELVVRDFVFDRAAQGELAATIEELPDDVIVSLKNTPHDYYPSFPDNPRLGRVGAHRQWVEYDTMGQYFGWGVAPAILIEEYRARLETAEARGATGVVFRTDWESLDGHSSFANLNGVNAIAGAALAQNRQADASGIVLDWLDQERHLESGLGKSERKTAAEWLAGVFAETLPITLGALYVQDCVFSDSSNYPISLAHALWLAEDKNSLKDWLPEKADALSSDQANLSRIFAEKDEAVERLSSLAERAKIPPSGFTTTFLARLGEDMEAYRLCVGAWRTVVRAVMLAKHLVEDGSWTEAGRLFEIELAELDRRAGEFRELAARTDMRFVVYNLLDPERLETLRDDLAAQVTAASSRQVAE